jgi:hypothetical protein
MSNDTFEVKAMKKTTGVFILILLLSGLALGLRAEDSSSIPPNVCERAFSDCLNDPMIASWAAYGTLYCLVGYAFCKKYIDPA